MVWGFESPPAHHDKKEKTRESERTHAFFYAPACTNATRGIKGPAPPAQDAVPPRSAEGAPQRGEAAQRRRGVLPTHTICTRSSVRPLMVPTIVSPATTAFTPSGVPV